MAASTAISIIGSMNFTVLIITFLPIQFRLPIGMERRRYGVRSELRDPASFRLRA